MPCFRRSPTVTACAHRWLAEKAASLAPHTREQYRIGIDASIIPTFGRVRVAVVTRALLRRGLAKWTTRLAPATIRARLPPLYGLLDDAVDDGWLPANPLRGLARRVLGQQRRWEPPPEKAFRELELARFFAAAPGVCPDLVDYWLSLHRAGLRPGEGLALEWHNVFEPIGKALVAHTYSQGDYGDTKNHRARWVDLSADLAAALAARRVRLPGRWVFPSPVNPAKPCSYRYIHTHFHRVLAAAALPASFTPQSFRHTWATWLAEEPGVPPTYLQTSLGHGSLRVTDRYIAGARVANPGHVQALDRRLRHPPIGIGSSLPDHARPRS